MGIPPLAKMFATSLINHTSRMSVLPTYASFEPKGSFVSCHYVVDLKDCQLKIDYTSLYKKVQDI